MENLGEMPIYDLIYDEVKKLYDEKKVLREKLDAMKELTKEMIDHLAIAGEWEYIETLQSKLEKIASIGKEKS